MKRGTICSLGIVGTAFLLAGCGETYEAAETCVDNRKNPPVVSEWKNCERDPKHFGTYSWQLPPQTSDGYYHGVVVPGVGQPVSGGKPGPARVSPSGKVAKPSSGSTISRGGLGVSGYSGSSGS